MSDLPFADPLAWRPVKAPSLEELEAMAIEAFRRLPDEFRALCQGVVVRVDDFPTDEVLKELGAETEFDLLGLFRGVGLAQGGGSVVTGQFPNHRAVPQHDLALPPPDPGLLVGARRELGRDHHACTST